MIEGTEEPISKRSLSHGPRTNEVPHNIVGVTNGCNICGNINLRCVHEQQHTVVKRRLLHATPYYRTRHFTRCIPRTYMRNRYNTCCWAAVSGWGGGRGQDKQDKGTIHFHPKRIQILRSKVNINLHSHDSIFLPTFAG